MMDAVSRWKRTALVAALVVPSIALVALSSPSTGRAAENRDGGALDRAAGSCWEIKQQNPSASDGVYWLLTAAMPAPQQFYCDMTTDGGGWVLVGKGRNGWTDEQQGVGNRTALLDTAFPGGRQTHQFSAEVIDQLLNGAPASSLTEGIRVRRASNTDGSQWQEARFRLRPLGAGNWTWAFSGGLPLQSYSFDGSNTNTSSANTSNFGSDNSRRRVNHVRREENGYSLGWAFGSQVSGTTADSSYLYSQNGAGYALPFTLMYLRPRVTSTVGFTPIGDEGLPGFERRQLPSSNADVMPWGVTGTKGSTSTEGNVEVQALVEAHGRMYVGGNFRYVQRNASGLGQVEQPFLAAFDLETGQWVTTFRPQLNEQVRALEVLPNGSIVAGGDFSIANGQPATAIVALHPDTGATDTSFDLTIQNNLSSGVLRVQALDVQGEYLYIGGAFTHMRGGGRSAFNYMRGVGRVLASNGRTEAGWNPEFNGTVLSVDASADGDRVYASGFFGTSKGVEARRAAAVLTAPGAALAQPHWQPVWSSATNDYQRAIRTQGERVWVGGSEHNLFGYSTIDFARIAASIMDAKGDLQAIEIDSGGVVYGGCHCNYFSYEGASRWPSPINWHAVYSMTWAGAWDAVTGERLPDWAPEMSSRLGSGTWAIVRDSNNRLWLGGDFRTARTASSPGTWTGAFVRFSPTDTTAPTTPANFRIVSQDESSVRLAWNGVSDPSGVVYHILREDRVVATTTSAAVTVPTSESTRYFLRAADGAGNYSATTPVLDLGAPPPNQEPTAAFTASTSGLELAVDATSSTDPDGTIVSYEWQFGDGEVGTGVTATHTYGDYGSYDVTLTVTDNRGATASVEQTVVVSELPSDLVPADATWRWRYLNSDPGAGWNDRGFDDSSWNVGQGRFGWGSAGIVTSLDIYPNTNDRPRAAHFRHSFTVSNPADFGAIEVTGLADDGAVFYLNGVEIGRQNMADRDDTYLTYAPTARRLSVAEAGPFQVTLPAGLLVPGENVFAASTHINYRGTPDMTFELTAVAAPAGGEAPTNQAPVAEFTASVNGLTVVLDGSASSDPDGLLVGHTWDFGDGSGGSGAVVEHTFAAPGTYTVTLVVSDSLGATGTSSAAVTVSEAPAGPVELVGSSTAWRWRYLNSDPGAGWNDRGYDDSSWNVGQGRFGWGSAGIVTSLDIYPNTNDRPRAAHFRTVVDVADPSQFVELEITGLADDGAFFYVNGVEVARQNMADREDTYVIYAPSARRVTVAQASPISVRVPSSLLVAGQNVIAASTHLNYRGTPDVTFEMSVVAHP